MVAQNTCLQFCSIGRNTFIGAGNTFTDFNLVPKSIRAVHRGKLEETGMPVLGGCVGHNCFIGSGISSGPMTRWCRRHPAQGWGFPLSSRWRRYGAVDYVAKPIDEQRLLRAVRQALVRHGTVLVVDDDPEIVRLLRAYLEQAG